MSGRNTQDAVHHNGYGGRMVYSGPDYVRDHRYEPTDAWTTQPIGVGALSHETSHDTKFVWRNEPKKYPFYTTPDKHSKHVGWKHVEFAEPPKYPIGLGAYRAEAEERTRRVGNLGIYSKLPNAPAQQSMPDVPLANAIQLYQSKVASNPSVQMVGSSQPSFPCASGGFGSGFGSGSGFASGSGLRNGSGFHN